VGLPVDTRVDPVGHAGSGATFDVVQADVRDTPPTTARPRVGDR
jgi:hypothetical protein